MNDLSSQNEQPFKIDFTNPTIAITAIIAVWSFCCFKTFVDAKYHRETTLSHDENGIYFTSRPVTTDNTITCQA